nr:uncharacterized protein LOC119717371 [Anas platyrhynchos]
MSHQQLTGEEVGHGRGGGTQLCPGAGSLRYKSDSSNRVGEEQQPRPLLLPPAASHSCQALMMKVQVLTVLPLLLAQLSLAPAQAEARGGSLQRQPRGWGPPEAPHPAGSGGDTLLGQGAEGSHPLAGAWEVLAEPPQAPSEARGSGQQGPPSQLRRRPPQPSRSRSLGLSQHLKGHGKFNADTHSCHGIQRRPCQKPSDCSGCLGLYTCKLPAGTCGLKAVSWQRGGFLRSIQSAGWHTGTLLPEPRGSK